LQARQLLRIFGDASQQLGVRARHADRHLRRVLRACRDGRQEQRPARDRHAMKARLRETHEDVPPIAEQRDESRRQAAAREVMPELNSESGFVARKLLILRVWSRAFAKMWCHVCLLFRLFLWSII